MHARVAGVFACVLTTTAFATEGVRWQVVSANDYKVGRAQVIRVADGAGVTVTERLEVRLGRIGRRVHYRLELETESGPDGSLRRMVREVETREGHSRVEARVAGDDLEIRQSGGGGQTIRRISGASAGLVSDEAAREWQAAIGRGEARPPLRLRTWDPVKLEVVEVELRMASDSSAWNPSSWNVERRIAGARGTTGSLLQVNREGEVSRELMTFAGIELLRADATETEAHAANEVFDHVAILLVRSPYRIPARDMNQKIRYGFDTHGTSVQLPSGGGQKTWSEASTTWLQVCASCPLEAADLPDEERQRALAPSAWLESADPQIARRAARIVGQRTHASVKMQRLAEFVRAHMGTQIDMLGYGTALEALRSRRGDCTEYAVLLAALGRAAGVPTRIAIGRVYARHFEGARHVFVPHAWVQAWTGVGWESFDAAIGNFDSTHLAFGVSYDGSPMNHHAAMKLSRELTLTQAARVIPRKTPAD